MTKKWLYGRNVVLTGCSTGMGKEVLMILVKKYGCNVMGVARNKAKLDELKEQLGDKFSYRRFNISSLQDWKDFASAYLALCPDLSRRIFTRQERVRAVLRQIRLSRA